jgi:hypothetical protein
MQIGNSSNNLLIQNGLTHGHLLKYIGINNAQLNIEKKSTIHLNETELFD